MLHLTSNPASLSDINKKYFSPKFYISCDNCGISHTIQGRRKHSITGIEYITIDCKLCNKYTHMVTRE